MTRVDFVSSELWRRITAAVRRRQSRCHVAIAYFGKGAGKLLPLTRGSTLVVDASDAAVKVGLTDPRELLKLIRRHVAVYSVSNLHAKVVVAGDEAFVGSMNASRRSARELIEAAIHTDHRSVVREARRFVESLASQKLGDEEVRQLRAL